jgi:uncharacterized protein (DUF427 family)
MSTHMQDLLARARGELRHQPIEKRVRAHLGDSLALETARAILVWEPRRVVPVFAVPADDIRAPLAPAPATDEHVEGVLHPGIPFAVHTAPGAPLTVGDRAGAGFRLADPDLAGYVALDFDAFDEWYEEDERIEGHPRDPFHRVDVRRSARSFRIELDGALLAETTRARLLFETQLPTRLYVPRDDVRADLLPSATRTYCPYKGHARAWSVAAGGRVHDDLAWSYAEPLPDAVAIAGLVAFWDERVDVVVDGERRPRPGGAISAALLDEFDVAAP